MVLVYDSEWGVIEEVYSVGGVSMLDWADSRRPGILVHKRKGRTKPRKQLGSVSYAHLATLAPGTRT